MTPEEARRQALIKFGGMESTKEACREQRGLPLLETLWQDVRFGLPELELLPESETLAAHDLLPLVYHCHPVLAKVAGCKLRNGKHMRMNDDVSDSDSVCRFFAAAAMPKWRHACWKVDFFATHRMDTSRAISPLRCSL